MIQGRLALSIITADSLSLVYFMLRRNTVQNDLYYDYYRIGIAGVPRNMASFDKVMVIIVR